jgi:hypothetical protein
MTISTFEMYIFKEAVVYYLLDRPCYHTECPPPQCDY